MNSVITQRVNSQLPALPSSIGKRRKIKMPPDNRILHFHVIDEICIRQSDNREKIICLQRIKFEQTGRLEVRLGYYIIGKKPRLLGKWVWGQYAVMIPLRDFKNIVRRAEKKGWL